jgi:hypothetical protein
VGGVTSNNHESHIILNSGEAYTINTNGFCTLNGTCILNDFIARTESNVNLQSGEIRGYLIIGVWQNHKSFTQNKLWPFNRRLFE